MSQTAGDVAEKLVDLALELGRADLAGDILRLASTQSVVPPAPDQADKLHRQALNHMNAQKWAEAIPLLHQAIRLKPQIDHWHETLGVAYAHLKRYAEALATLRIALKLNSNDVRIWNNLALAYLDVKNYPEAERAYREMVKRNPESFDYRCGLIRVLNDQKKLTDAETEARELTRRHPDNAGGWSTLGIIIFHLKKHEEAIQVLRKANEMKPNDAELLTNLAAALGQTKQWQECERVSRRATELNPAYSTAWGNLGNCLREQGSFADAEKALRETLRLNPRDADAASNLALTLGTVGRYAEATAWYDHSLAIKPDQGSVLFNRSLNMLILGDFERGWVDYERRFETQQLTGAKRTYPVPEWTGGPLDRRTILITYEQGAGDVIQFIRYAKDLTAMGATVLVQPTQALVSLIRTVPGVSQVIDDPQTQITIHTYCSVMSLPYRLGIRLNSIGNHVPYITPPADLVEKWKARLATIPGFKVGIAWQGNPKHVGDRWRSVPLSYFEPLAKVPGVSLCSLQLGPGSEQLKDCKFPIIDLGAEIQGDFSDTAALINELDLIISIDTSTIHLAGAMGKPVWVAIAFNNDWRWLRDRKDTPWYPSMTLFRQPQLGDWPTVFQQLTQALNSQVHSVAE